MKLDYIDNTPAAGPLVVQDLVDFKDSLALFQMELELKLDGDVADAEPDELYIPTEFLADFGFPHLQKLDAEGLMFLECYRELYSQFVSIGLESSNYFLETFLGLAANNEGITYALTAWGGFFLELRKRKSDFSRAWRYMQKAARHMCTQMGNDLVPRDKDDFFLLFAFYLIFIGIEVCTGDVRNWQGFMGQCRQMLAAYGGPAAVLRMFANNDIKWMLADYQFHDLLSSRTLLTGTMFPVAEYDQVMAPDARYGIDPLQGIAGPLYNIMGDIGNLRAQLHQMSPDPADIERRSQHCARVEQAAADLSEKITRCEPLPVHLSLLKGPDKDLHLLLFDLYKHICQLQLATSVRRLPPNTPAQQGLLMKSLLLLDALVPTRLKVSLSLALLVCGITCCTDHDRAAMVKRFRLHLNQYEIGNLQRIEETVVSAWLCNPTGAVCVDWAELVRDKGWHLYVG